MINHSKTAKVILIRHAQSTWNAQTRFTGWADPPLTALGVSEAQKAGELLAESDIHFDMVYTSVLQRAKQTADIILETTGQTHLPQKSDWRLNERHYGQLQGLNKIEIAEKVGEEQVLKWRRGYLDKPQPLADDDDRHPRFDAKYKDLPETLLPAAENLADTQKRVLQFWSDTVEPAVKDGKTLLISSHGNTLRALIMALSNMSSKEVETFEIPTGIPIVYTLNQDASPKHWQYLKESEAA
ncbi:2,3-bisphosphoglycerate-dependent phosphoglycerate mutase [Thalassocella blandensis]|nr:2,3-bisphosphoglycerate-dependent phosphoglycerate mutase [Thalassocella blandensis]